VNYLLDGQHLLNPGVVFREVLTVNSQILVRTTGYGMGLLPQINSGQAAQWIWTQRTDGKIKSALGF
jgi:hypothetical protein